MKKQNKLKGFTLAELLIVVAIIGILVAISIPIFNKKLEKAREAYDLATMRQAASAAIDLYYAGICNSKDAEKYGLAWWGSDTASNANAWGAYDPQSGTFKNDKSKVKAYGKGTKANAGTVYTMGNEHGASYDAELDYTDGIVMVAIYPNAKKKHADIYWKYTKNDNYIGGAHAVSDPNLCIRIYLH